MTGKKSLIRRLAGWLGALGLVCLHGWALLALFIWFNGHPLLSWGVVLGYLAALAGIFKVARTLPHGALASLVLYLAMFLWWTARKPETGLIYPREAEQEAKVVVEGNEVTIHGIRDFRYRSPEDFDARWATRTYDLNQLEHVDFIFIYWGVPDVAHVITSFVFRDQPPVDVSVELRHEAGEPNTLLRGFFKQYELYYIWSDERDVVKLRTNYRKDEEAYLYRSTMPPDRCRRLFLDMAAQSNALTVHPEFYNTLTDNCTNVIARHVRHITGQSRPFWKRTLLTGKLEKRGYDEGWLLHTLPWEEHRAAAHINERARAAGDAPDFSAKIRSHLPPDPEKTDIEGAVFPN